MGDAVNERLKGYARDNRRSPTEPEIRLWRHLSGSRLGGLKFRRQYVIRSRILDFFCASVALGVEIDGITQDPVADRLSDSAMAREGVAIFRFSNADVMQNMEGVLTTILAAARARPKRWAATVEPPHPNPSPEGEGLA